MDCPYCDISLNNIDKYLFHLRYIHKINTFTSHYNNCLRTFHRKDSFKKHFLNHEYDTSLRKLVHIPPIDTIQAHSSNSNLGSKFVLQTGSSTDNIKDAYASSSHEVNNSCNEGTTNYDISSFLKKQYVAFQKFVVELYNSSLTKSDIQKIMDIFQTFYTDLLNETEQIVLNCDVDKILSCFKIIVSYFDNFNTEYKRELFF